MVSPFPHHPTSMPPSLPSTQASWPPGLAGRETVSFVCYCVRGAKPADSVGYSTGQAEKRLGSLASCWGSEPWPAWSVKPCQMEPFQNNESCFAMVENSGLVAQGTQRVGIYLHAVTWMVYVVYCRDILGSAVYSYSSGVVTDFCDSKYYIQEWCNALTYVFSAFQVIIDLPSWSFSCLCFFCFYLIFPLSLTHT